MKVSQNVQISTYKISSKDVMYNMINISKCHMLCMEVVNRVNPKNSRHKRKSISLTLYLYVRADVHSSYCSNVS